MARDRQRSDRSRQAGAEGTASGEARDSARRYLSSMSVSYFQAEHEAALPDCLTGAEFLAAGHAHLDDATTILPDRRCGHWSDMLPWSVVPLSCSYWPLFGQSFGRRFGPNHLGPNHLVTVAPFNSIAFVEQHIQLSCIQVAQSTRRTCAARIGLFRFCDAYSKALEHTASL